MKSLRPALTAEVAESSVQATVTGAWRERGQAILEISPETALDGDLSRVVIEGPRHGVGVVDPQSGRLYLRFAGGTLPRLPLSFVAISEGQTLRAGRTGARGGSRVTIQVEGAMPRLDKGLKDAWHVAASRWFDGRSGGYAAYATARFRALAGEAARQNFRWNRRRRHTEIGELMRLYTGLTSIDEALQTDRGLRLSQGKRPEATLDINTLEGVDLEPHPWPRMISELPGSPKPIIEPLARYIPRDTLYLHAHDMRTFVAATRELDERFGPLVQALELSSGATHFLDRIQTRLAVERTGLSEKLGHLAAHGVALSVGEPGLREGADVALMFHVNQRPLLTTTLAAFLRSAEARHGALTRTTWRAHGRQVEVWSSADGAVQRHQADLGEVIVLATHKAAMERILAVAAGKGSPLTEAGDFQYMRARYPFDRKAEDIFVFIGDDLVAKVVGPKFKILQARRMAARADLQAVAHAALLYGWLNGKRPANAQALVKAGLLEAAGLRHADGSKITFDPETGPRSLWGHPGALTPSVELVDRVKKVTKAEADAYKRFKRTYQQYWRAFIDPVAVQMKRVDGSGYTFDAHILPLIDSSDYRELEVLVGRNTANPPPAPEGLRWVVALGEDARIRRELDGFASRTLNLGALSWLGDWAAVGVLDDQAVWQMAQATGSVMGVERGGSNSEIQAFTRLPLYALVQIKNPLALASTLGALKALIGGVGVGVRWGPSTPYREVQVIEVRGEDMSLGAGLAVHYAVVGDVWALSLTRPALERLIDDLLTRKANGQKGKPLEVQARLSVQPAADGWLVPALLSTVEARRVGATHQAGRMVEVLNDGLRGLPEGSSARRTAALAWLGRVPTGLYGKKGAPGEWRLDADGAAHHQVYGSAVAPRLPVSPEGDESLAAAVQALKRLAAGVAFEGEGDHRGLRVMAELIGR